MLGYELYKKWQSLNPAKRDYAIGFLTGAVGMDYEGHTKPNENQPAAKYTLTALRDAINAAIDDQKTNRPPIGINEIIVKAADQWPYVNSREYLVDMLTGIAQPLNDKIFALEAACNEKDDALARFDGESHTCRTMGGIECKMCMRERALGNHRGK